MRIPRYDAILQGFLGESSTLTAPLTDLVGECCHTEVMKRNGTKKKPWYWNEKQQSAFEWIKNTLAREMMLAYPNFNEEFEIYCDASTRKLVVSNNSE